MRARATLDLRKIRLADGRSRPGAFSGGAAQFLAQGPNHFLLRHGTIEPAQRAFHLAQIPDFLAQFHRLIPNRDIYIAICDLCQESNLLPSQWLGESQKPLNKQTPRNEPGRRSGLRGGESSCRLLAAVLIAIDLARLAVLLAVDLLLFLSGQLAAIGLAVGADLPVDARLILLEVGSLARRQLAVLDPVGDAVLLILLALAHFTLRICVLHGRIVLVVVNLMGKLVLLLVQRGFVRVVQVAVIPLTHVALFLFHLRLLLFEIRSFTRGQLSALHAVGDAVLLILLAVLDALAIDGRRVVALSHNWQREQHQGRAEKCRLHGVLHKISPWIRFLFFSQRCGPREEKPAL